VRIAGRVRSRMDDQEREAGGDGGIRTLDTDVNRITV
jgi:hypothetical protein